MKEPMTASARKTRQGKYKPMIRYGDGRTKILGSRGHTEHWRALTNTGETWRWDRNKAQYADRNEAIAHAQRHIDKLRQSKVRADARVVARKARYNEQMQRSIEREQASDKAEDDGC